MVIFITVACCYAVHNRKKRNDHYNTNAYEFNSNAAYHTWNHCRGLVNGHGGFDDDSSPTNTIYDYVRNDSAPSKPRREQLPSTGEVSCDSDFTVQ